MAIAQYPVTVIDCPDPLALATFYGDLLGWSVSGDQEWAEAKSDYGQMLCFQAVENYRAPQWPDQQVPQQTHLDLSVADLDHAEQQVLDLGATKHEVQPGETFRVFLDPAGHPFCLCVS
ncbi:VOC family protein [Aestuariimicrobium kwangyangense]|uniref:VOC family protein n=1 Tax=Aestuariimicrobium kwangyangense TaxID=396389 RepID=UPI0003B73F6F|nr:VOC family protein [Aestuariimicrobium kwangyangense]